MTQVAPHSHRSGGGQQYPADPRSPRGNAGGPYREDMSLGEGEARGRHATTYGQGFGGVVLWTILGSFLPGSGLVVAGRRALGFTVLAINVLLVGGVLAAVYVAGVSGIIDFAASPGRLVVAATVVLVLVLLWSLVVLGTHASLRRYAHLTLPQRVLSSGLVVAIVGLVLIPAARAADYSLIYKDAANSIFASDGTSGGTTTNSRPNAAKADPWANIPRVNVLMLGSDAGSDRTGIRTDTVILASINTKTGRTVLFSLPRNLQGVPFPAGSAQAAAYPNGFRCPDESCMLNALWTFGVEHRAQYYSTAKSDFEAGYTAIKQGVEQTLGVTVDTYAVVDMKGLQDFIDAIGGVTIPVPEKLAIGGSHNANGTITYPKAYLQPGVQHLNGYYAMWYARSRFNTDDYKRMARQRCLLGYVLDQTDPLAVLRAFPGIAKAAKSNIRTGIQLDSLSAWAELALRVKKGGVSSLTFTRDVLGTTADPDFQFIQERVQTALTAQPKPTATTTPSPSPSATRTGGTPSASPTSTVPADEAASLKDVCPPVP